MRATRDPSPNYAAGAATVDSAVTGSPVLGRRERKKRATRLALKAAAIDLIAERGYGNVTVEDIADAVDVSVRTFFNYFDSKDAALVGEDPELIQCMRSQLLELEPELGPLEALTTVLLARIRAIGEDIDQSGEGHEVWLRRLAVIRTQPEVLVAYAKHLAVVEQALIEGLVERLGGNDQFRPYATLLSVSAVGVMRVAGMCWGGEGGSAALLEFTSAAFDLLGGGLSSAPLNGPLFGSVGPRPTSLLADRTEGEHQ